jgi:hypothetical protein
VADVLIELAADGGHAAGMGHVGRCVALAQALGGDALLTVADPAARAFAAGHGVAAGAPGTADAAPVLVLDRRAPAEPGVVRAAQARGRAVALLDDLGPARAIADLVIDPPTAAAWPPAAGARLDGFAHALLRAEVVAAATAPRRVASVLLAMGGSDPAGRTAGLAAALAATGLELAIALGPAYAGPRALPGTVLPTPGAFAAALAGADLLVCGYGHSLLEAAHLGVPAVAVIVVPGHGPHAAAFAAHGSAVVAPHATPDGAVAALAAGLLADPDRRAAMAARGRALVDGRGAARVAAALRATARPTRSTEAAA